MTKTMNTLFKNFRIPSLSAMIAEVEQVYLDGAESHAERDSRRREIRGGRFRNWNW